MANRIFKESFTEKYHGVNPPTIMPEGAIVDGLNIRKIAAPKGNKNGKIV